MKKIIAVIFILLCFFLCSDYGINLAIKQFDRTMVLDNGLTFDVHSSYHNHRMCVYLSVSNGWARLMPDEAYDIHLVDYNGNDIAFVKFYNKDFTEQSAFKCITIDKSKLLRGEKFKMRYPAWIVDK